MRQPSWVLKLFTGAFLPVLGLYGCDPGPDQCRDVTRDDPCEKLSGYGFFQGALSSLTPAAQVTPYSPNTPLFSDYAVKFRFLYLPQGEQVSYTDMGAFDPPVGSFAIKTFTYPLDMRNPQLGQRIIETRLLMHQPDGWQGLPYIWNDDQTEATLNKLGTHVEVNWIHTDGTMRSDDYVVPNTNMCKDCHESDQVTMKLIGIKAGQLNGDYAYPGGSQNQLAYWSAQGVLTGAPTPGAAPKLPVWNDPTTGSVTDRARAWLDVNCAHCHDDSGMASTTGLDLRYEQTDPAKLGQCKSPVAAGKGTGGRLFDVVPGQPDQSVLVYRIESTEPKVMMPEDGRQLADTEGIALIRQWITELPGSCP